MGNARAGSRTLNLPFSHKEGRTGTRQEQEEGKEVKEMKARGRDREGDRESNSKRQTRKQGQDQEQRWGKQEGSHALGTDEG